MRLDISIMMMINYQVSDRRTCPIAPSHFRDIQNKIFKNHNFFIFVYNMIKNGVSISENFVGLMIKPTSKSISTHLKLELTKMNLSSVKIPRKRTQKEKIPYFFHLGISIPTCKPTTCKYSLP
jgi:hypothetical protein